MDLNAIYEDTLPAALREVGLDAYARMLRACAESETSDDAQLEALLGDVSDGLLSLAGQALLAGDRERANAAEMLGAAIGHLQRFEWAAVARPSGIFDEPIEPVRPAVIDLASHRKPRLDPLARVHVERALELIHAAQAQAMQATGVMVPGPIATFSSVPPRDDLAIFLVDDGAQYHLIAAGSVGEALEVALEWLRVRDRQAVAVKDLRAAAASEPFIRSRRAFFGTALRSLRQFAAAGKAGHVGMLTDYPRELVEGEWREGAQP
jgi:hypothetical protein